MNYQSFFKIALTCFCFFLFLDYEVNAQSAELKVFKIKDAKSLKKYFYRTGNDVPIVSGHRGGMTAGFPENSIETFENTLKYVPAFFEIDPRLTKDSIPVLMHDATLDRTTTGKGKVGDYTLAELQQFRLKDAEGNITQFKIPTLMEALIWSKGKTVMNLDYKDVPLAMTAKIIKESKNEVVMVTVHNAKQARFYLNDNPDRMFSAHILTKKAFLAYEAEQIPWENMIAYIGPKHTPENKELMNLLQAKGVMCMISSASSYDKLKTEIERTENYRKIFNEGADILESDLPIQVANAIKDLNTPNNPKKSYLGISKLKTN
jgi:glycerophosphoryl diester phosphodiesterase